ncbi:M15 family metallopeptidase [Nocardia sp. CA-290969]|uniref:M15 family metallopeptidase n=1 Tax=Nocardia sp. CA-290969 TaxID=3239986 RepID=UPI003D8EE0FA
MGFRTVYGYSVSENGWRMVDRDMCVVGGPSIGLPNTNTAPLRAGDASTILVAWLAWYHRNVEPLRSPVWGWSATNDVANSNHLSGTAVDINAPQYPWGYRTMPRDRIAKVRVGLALFESTVFWGADWSRADEMHYQLGFREGDPRIAAFAHRLNAGHLGIYGTPSKEDDDMTPEQDAMLRRVHKELTQPYPSRSAHRQSDQPVDTLAGMLLNADARVHEASIEIPKALAELRASIDALPEKIADAIARKAAG